MKIMSKRCVSRNDGSLEMAKFHLLGCIIGECPKPLTYEEFFNARKKER
jgi:hypothetical protein